MNTREKTEPRKLQLKRDTALDGFQDLFNPPRLSKPEMHLLLKPFFIMDRHADRFKPIDYTYSVIDNSKATTRRWFVQPHALYGLPGTFDRDVTIVIYEIVNQNYLSKGLPVPRLMPIGSLCDFAEQMGITSHSGKNIATIKDSLKRLTSTLASCEDTFFDNKKKRYITVSFRLLAGVGFADEEENGIRHDQNFVMFDEIILSNLNTGYVMVIDVDCVRSLSTNIAKQLYSHLAYRFFVEAKEGDTSWIADYDWLSIHLGIKRASELWRAKQQLQEAHEELKRLGYISDYRWDGWRVIYCPGPIWQGEQLRRKSGKARHRTTKSIKSAKPKELIQVIREPHDSLIPALAAFACGLPVGEERIRALGLTSEEAKVLCLEKGILTPPK